MYICEDCEIMISIFAGNTVLDESHVKEIKLLCKNKLVNIKDVFELIMGHLSTRHCQVNYKWCLIFVGLNIMWGMWHLKHTIYNIYNV